MLFDTDWTQYCEQQKINISLYQNLLRHVLRGKHPSLYSHTLLMLLSQKRICCVVCSKSIITHTGETLLTYLRIMQTWVLSGFPQIKHCKQNSPWYIYMQKLWVSDFSSLSSSWWLVSNLYKIVILLTLYYITVLHYCACSGGFFFWAGVFLACGCDFSYYNEGGSAKDMWTLSFLPKLTTSSKHPV